MAIAELKCCQLVLERVQAAASGGYCHVYYQALAFFPYQQDVAAAVAVISKPMLVLHGPSLQ